MQKIIITHIEYLIQKVTKFMVLENLLKSFGHVAHHTTVLLRAFDAFVSFNTHYS